MRGRFLSFVSFLSNLYLSSLVCVISLHNNLISLIIKMLYFFYCIQFPLLKESSAKLIRTVYCYYFNYTVTKICRYKKNLDFEFCNFYNYKKVYEIKIN